jgi:hypothetical protein
LPSPQPTNVKSPIPRNAAERHTTVGEVTPIVSEFCGVARCSSGEFVMNVIGKWSERMLVGGVEGLYRIPMYKTEAR